MGKPSKLSIEQRIEAVLSLLRREESAAKIARRYGVSEQTLSRYRDQFLEGGKAGLASSAGRADLLGIASSSWHHQHKPEAERARPTLAIAWPSSARATTACGRIGRWCPREAGQTDAARSVAGAESLIRCRREIPVEP